MMRAADAALPAAVVTMPAEIDIANASRLGAELDSAIKPGVKALVIDMRFTTFCDSQDVNAIARIWRRAEAEGVCLRLVAGSPQVLRILAVTALDTVVPVCRRLEDALGAGGNPAEDAGG